MVDTSPSLSFKGTMDYGTLFRRPVILRRKKRLSTASSDDSTAIAVKSGQANPNIPPRLTNPFRRTSQTSSPHTPEKSRRLSSTASDSQVIPATPEKKSVLRDDNSPYSCERRVKRLKILSEDDLSSSQSLPLLGIPLLGTPLLDTTEPTPSARCYDRLPPDPSLSSRVRFSFGVSRDTSSPDNVASFIQSVEVNQHDAMKNFLSSNNQTTGLALRFAELLYYWSFPDLPWINTFPRNVKSKVSQSSSTITTSMSKSLREKFNSAIDSVFTELLATDQLRPLESTFHILGDSYSVLLHKCSVCTKSYAVLSPSTRGLRNALSHLGIKFELPLHTTSPEDNENRGLIRNYKECESEVRAKVTTSPDCIQSGGESPVKEADLSSGDLEGSESEPLNWLESIGLDRHHFPSLRTSKVQMASESFRQIDYQPSSTVLIQQEYLPKFSEFIKTFEKTISTTGPLANVPPTVLSTQPFLHGSLNRLKVSHGTHRTSSRQTINFIDLLGPILPGVTPTLTRDVLSDLAAERCTDLLQHNNDLHGSQGVSVKCSKLTNPQAFNIHSCSLRTGQVWTGALVDREPETISNFDFKNGKFYIDSSDNM